MDRWFESVGRRLAQVIDQYIEAGGAPGAVTIAGDMNDAVVLSRGVVAPGLAEVPASVTVRYDIASLTKVVATWPLTGMVVAAGELDLDKPLSGYLGSSSLPGSIVTTRQILCHTSGLRAVTRFDQYVGRGEELVELILGEELDAEPGSRVVYINRGFILLGLLLERILGTGLDVAARERVWQPWGLRHTGFGPFAATADVAPTERRLGGAKPSWGVVHDENAALMGGTAGHAGVFSTAEDLARFCRAVLGFVSDGTAFGSFVAESFQEQAAGDAGRRGLGWLVLPESGVVYHHGFTGVSLYLAPTTRRFVVLLSNAVHQSRDRAGLTGLRAATLEVFRSGST
jgi:CubicO group peptidase (beta-lactamase class C family)